MEINTDGSFKGQVTFATLPDDTKVVSATCRPDGTLEIVRQKPSNIAYGNGRRAPDTVWKEIYGAQDGKIVLINKISGRHTPAAWVPESITFD